MSKEKGGQTPASRIEATLEAALEGKSPEEREKYLYDAVVGMRNEAAGRDRRIGELTDQINEMSNTEDTTDDVKATVDRLKEMIGELKAREKDIDAQQKALNTAIEKGIPVTLAIRNANDLDALVEEVDGLSDDILKGVHATYINKQLATTVKRGKGLSHAQLGKLSAPEWGNLPPAVRDLNLGKRLGYEDE